MDLVTSALIDVGYFLAVTTILVMVHELGHYLAARANGVRVEACSLGFGPELFGCNDRHGTRWKVSAIPLGGYIKMFGEDAETALPGSPLQLATQAVSFRHKRLTQRASIAIAGPLANLVFGILLIAGLLAIVDPPSAPAAARSILDQSLASLWRAGEIAWHLSFEIAQAIWQVGTGARSPKELIGPVRMVQVSGAVAHQGILPLSLMTAILSVNLAVTNLLPIPTLDGGHLLFCLAEAIRGRPLGRQAEIFAMRVGLAFVAVLMLFTTWNDLVHLSGL